MWGKGGWGGKGYDGGWGGGGKGCGKWGKQEQVPWEAVPGLSKALTECMSPIASEEPEFGDLIKLMIPKVKKVCDKWTKDERLNVKITGIQVATQTKVYIEEFVEHCMSALSGPCYEKTWFGKVDFTNALMILVLHTLSDAKMFSRTLKPQLAKYVQEGLFKWQEEERITQAMTEAVTVSGFTEGHHKFALQALKKGYDDAHYKAPYGSTENASAEIKLLQDFVVGWMTEFHYRAQDTLAEVQPSRDAQISQMAVLFQRLLDPNIACMPYEIATEITNAVGGLPAAPWGFVNQAAAEIYMKADQLAERKGKGKAKRAKMM